jgi:hypothetical protein
VFIGGSDPIMDDDEAALVPPWREKHGVAEPEALSGKLCPTPRDRVGGKPSPAPVGAAHAEFVASLTRHPPRPITIYADAIDLEDRSYHLSRVLSAVSVYVTAIVDDTAQNAPGNIELCDIEAILSDLASDLTGAIRRAGDDMAGRPE